jgi:hypothetical protein
MTHQVEELAAQRARLVKFYEDKLAEITKDIESGRLTTEQTRDLSTSFFILFDKYLGWVTRSFHSKEEQ